MRRMTGLFCAVTSMFALLGSDAFGQVGVATPAYQYRSSTSTYQSLNWLFNPSIAKELEIVPEQTEELTAIRKEMTDKMRELYKSFADLNAQERQKKYYEAYAELGKEAEKKVGEVLVAQQLDRLKQIMLQMRMRSTGYGSASALSGDDVANALGLTDEQKQLLQKKEAEWRVEMREKTQEFYKTLQQEGREKLLGVLTESQRKKLDELTGKQFEWQTTRNPGGASQGGQVQKQ